MRFFQSLQNFWHSFLSVFIFTNFYILVYAALRVAGPEYYGTHHLNKLWVKEFWVETKIPLIPSFGVLDLLTLFAPEHFDKVNICFGINNRLLFSHFNNLLFLNGRNKELSFLQPPTHPKSKTSLQSLLFCPWKTCGKGTA